MTTPLRVMAWNVEGVHVQEDGVHDAVGDFQPARNPNGVTRSAYNPNGTPAIWRT